MKNYNIANKFISNKQRHVDQKKDMLATNAHAGRLMQRTGERAFSSAVRFLVGSVCVVSKAGMQYNMNRPNNNSIIVYNC